MCEYCQEPKKTATLEARGLENMWELSFESLPLLWEAPYPGDEMYLHWSSRPVDGFGYWKMYQRGGSEICPPAFFCPMCGRELPQTSDPVEAVS